MNSPSAPPQSSYEDIIARRDSIQRRLEEIQIPPKPNLAKRVSASYDSCKGLKVPLFANSFKKDDTHHDFMLKEMQWLAADYSAERKRHIAASRKISSSVLNYFNTKSIRQQKEIVVAKQKNKKLANRISKIQQNQFWLKLEKLITYKQKMNHIQNRNTAMNLELIQLIKQTEKFAAESYVPTINLRIEEWTSQNPKDEMVSDDHDNLSGEKRLHEDIQLDPLTLIGQKRYRPTPVIADDSGLSSQLPNKESKTIQSMHKQSVEDDTKARYSTRSKRKVRFDPILEGNEQNSLISDTSDHVVSNSLESYLPFMNNCDNISKALSVDSKSDNKNSIETNHAADDDDEDFVAQEMQPDDETTMELKESLPQDMSAQDEIRLLNEENEMSIDELRARYASAYDNHDVDTSEEDDDDDDEEEEEETKVTYATRSQRNVRFDPSLESKERNPSISHTSNHDVSNIFESSLPSINNTDKYSETLKLDSKSDDKNSVETNHVDDDDEDFVAQEMQPDDETTMELEENLPQDMTAQEEIRLLNEENEMSIDELRARYASAYDNHDVDTSDDDEVEEEETKVTYSTRSQRNVRSDPSLESKERNLSVLHTSDHVVSNSLESSLPSINNSDKHSETFKLDSKSDDKNSIEINHVDDDDEDFVAQEMQPDDETTMELEENLPQDMTAQEEIRLLNEENEMSIDELRARYASGYGNHDVDMSEEEEDDDDEKSSHLANDLGEIVSIKDLTNCDKDTGSLDSGELKSLTDIQILESDKRSDEKCENGSDIHKTNEIIRPFLLAPWIKIRDYQLVGLGWLESLHSRGLNGILADEMGLGKTLQTIGMISYLAAYKGVWGPHLIVVPTSVMLNWEYEFKRFCPALKVICYYGSAKRRKELRTGWQDSNWSHVIITSYQLAVQDAFAFKRKRWYYLVLDEAQHIKNFQSQRWQTLIHFNTQRRLLLTGTPLQNNLMELWSLLHFLMPHVFKSRKEFSYWFANPMSDMIEGNAQRNEDVVNRLHAIIRPFVLRRLKKDVETQMPGKFEHIVTCQLSRRQMLIYEEFMSRSSTRQALRKGGNFMGMMNVLMQLRKVCNHPDLFEPRAVLTPFTCDPVVVQLPSCVHGALSSVSPFDGLSQHILSPIWSGSTGSISVDSALRHDAVVSQELLELESSIEILHGNTVDILEDYDVSPKALKGLIGQIYANEQRYIAEKTVFLNRLSSQRCRKPNFPFPQRLIDAVRIPLDSLHQHKNSVIDDPSMLLMIRKDQLKRAKRVDELVTRFVFCVPKAASRAPPSISCTKSSMGDTSINAMLLEPIKDYLQPFQEARGRLSAEFPDKKLVQFDSGKLQKLAELLRERKRGGHKVLIFTQMSKMLDILEAFLNLNGHTYLRLDGSTGVDRRQRLMDRFNSDPKIFCFILSTRSGGVGINLTGADTVVFYDSDWNPAIDAQAQDRAHRIGQTRDVHIYRLVTEHSVEENILLKAKQKRNLDILVLDEGKFDASASTESGQRSSEVKDVYTKRGLRSILGIGDEENENGNEVVDPKLATDEKDYLMSNDQIEKTMISLEDVDDVDALLENRKEVDEELKEFDETVEYSKDSDDEADNVAMQGNPSNSLSVEQEREHTEEKEMEKEFAAWQTRVGIDVSAVGASLSSVENYGLRFREHVDPYRSIYADMEDRRQLEEENRIRQVIDVDEVKRQKAEEEQRAANDGDLLVSQPNPDSLLGLRNMYRQERSRVLGNRRRRKLTGDNWERRIDAHTQHPFWYDIDAGEARWDKPDALHQLESYNIAVAMKWIALPFKPLVHLMGFLLPFPDRCACSRVCRQWQKAATDVSFIRHVYPVEMIHCLESSTRIIEPNHYRTIAEAIRAALPGDTIELSDGHYWQNSDLLITKPLRLIGDENNPSNVVVEVGGSIDWKGSGYIEGITFRRIKMALSDEPKSPILRIIGRGKLDMACAVLDNEGSSGNVIDVVGPGRKGIWRQTVVTSGSVGVSVANQAQIDFIECIIKKNHKSIECDGSSVVTDKNCIFD